MLTEAWLRTARATFHASFTNSVRFYTTSGWLVSSLLMPIFLLAGAAVVARFIAPGGAPPRFVELTGYTDYLAFVVLGLATNGLVMSSLEDGGNAIYEEESAGTWELLALTPMNRFVWMFSKTLAGLVNSMVDLVIVLTLGIVAFGIHLAPQNLGVALLGLALTVVGLQGLSFLFAAAGLVWKQPFALAIILSPVLMFLTGMMFPVQALPGWVQAISAIIPLTHGLHIVREAALAGAGLGELAGSFGLLLLTGAVLMAIGFATFVRMERKARRDGAMGRY